MNAACDLRGVVRAPHKTWWLGSWALVIKHSGQGDSWKKGFILPYGSAWKRIHHDGEAVSIVAGPGCCSRTRMLRACSHLQLHAQGKDCKRSKACALPALCISSSKDLPPNVSTTSPKTPPSGDQVFKHMDLWETFSFKLSKCVIPACGKPWEAGERLSPVQSQATP